MEPSLNRSLLQSRILPYNYLADVEPTEQALCIRTAAAVGITTQPPPLIESNHQARFQFLIRDCSFETWLTAFTAPWSATQTRAIVWSAVNPTQSTILTLARPSSYTLDPGWLVDARAAINLTPYTSMRPAGMAWLNLDLSIRPNPAHERTGFPLSLDGLFGVFCIQGRVAGGVAAPGSRGSRRDSLPSPGSSHQPVSKRGPSANGRTGRDLFRGARPTTA